MARQPPEPKKPCGRQSGGEKPLSLAHDAHEIPQKHRETTVRQKGKRVSKTRGNRKIKRMHIDEVKKAKSKRERKGKQERERERERKRERESNIQERFRTQPQRLTMQCCHECNAFRQASSELKKALIMIASIVCATAFIPAETKRLLCQPL